MTQNDGPTTDVLPESKGWSRGLPRRRGLVTALAAMAILQVMSILYLAGGLSVPPPFVTTGHDLSELTLRETHGALLRLGTGQPTLLLVFDPDCVHSRRVAPLWSNWLEGNARKGYRIIAISGSPAAVDYVRARRWPVSVASAEPANHAVAARTPWAFAVDEDGRVVAERHGRHLAEVAEELSRTDTSTHGPASR